MAVRTNIRSVNRGFEWSIERGMEPYYDERGDRLLDSPDEIIGGWARSEAAAEEAIADHLLDNENGGGSGA